MARAVLGDPAVDEQYASLAALMDEYIGKAQFKQLGVAVLEDLRFCANAIASQADYHLHIRQRQSASQRAAQEREAHRLRDARSGTVAGEQPENSGVRGGTAERAGLEEPVVVPETEVIS